MASGKTYKITRDSDISEDALLASINLKAQAFKETARPAITEKIALPSEDPFSEEEAGEKRLMSSKPKMVFSDF